MIQKFNEFYKINEESNSKLESDEIYYESKPTHKVIIPFSKNVRGKGSTLNGGDKAGPRMVFDKNDKISFFTQSGSLGVLVNVSNHTKKEAGDYWSRTYGVDFLDKIKKI